MQNKTYVALIYPVDNSLTYVTHVDSRDHTALWESGKPAVALDQRSAEDLYFGLRCNGYKALIVTLPAYEEPRNPEKEDWFGNVRWCNEDIEYALDEHGYRPTDEAVAVIRKKCEHHSFWDGMVETGWDYINAYIDESKDELDAMRKEN